MILARPAGRTGRTRAAHSLARRTEINALLDLALGQARVTDSGRIGAKQLT